RPEQKLARDNGIEDVETTGIFQFEDALAGCIIFSRSLLIKLYGQHSIWYHHTYLFRISE
ncbi:MAG: hypothetical protein WCO00_11875, partial [Rhodospirillaceae bacterium]